MFSYFYFFIPIAIIYIIVMQIKYNKEHTVDHESLKQQDIELEHGM